MPPNGPYGSVVGAGVPLGGMDWVDEAHQQRRRSEAELRSRDPSQGVVNPTPLDLNQGDANRVASLNARPLPMYTAMPGEEDMRRQLKLRALAHGYNDQDADKDSWRDARSMATFANAGYAPNDSALAEGRVIEAANRVSYLMSPQGQTESNVKAAYAQAAAEQRRKKLILDAMKNQDVDRLLPQDAGGE